MISPLDNHTHRLVRHFAALICLLLCGAYARAQVTTSPIPQPDPPAPVVDYANVIDDATEQRLNNILKNLSENKKANVEMAVVTVDTTGGRDISQYSLEVMRGWGVGGRKRGEAETNSEEKGGLVLLVAVKDRKYFTQVSRHLEGDMPDSLVGQLQRQYLVPQFKAGDYSKGISDTVDAYVATLAEKRDFSIEGIDQRKAYREPEYASEPAPVGSASRRRIPTALIIGLVIILFLVLSSRGGRAGSSGCGGGCLNFLLLNSLMNSGRGGWGSSGWGGGGGFGGSGGWGGGGGGGGGDWGGFSGGGGDAGGGGAGGSW